jgi:hypothetical protein
VHATSGGRERREQMHLIQALLPNFTWVDLDVFAILADSLTVLVSFQRLAHVKCIATVVIVVNDSPVDRVSGEMSADVVDIINYSDGQMACED